MSLLSESKESMHFISPAKPRRPSLTPLIDVVFILLLFFMLASNFSREGVIDVSVSAESTARSTDSQALVVNIEKIDLIRVDSVTTSLNDLADLLVEKFSENTNRMVNVRLAASVNVQLLVSVLDVLNKSGFENIALQETN